MERENARTLRVNSGSERGREKDKERERERERGNKRHDKSHESRLSCSFEEGHRGRRDGEGEALLPIVVRTDINVGKKAREEG